jgi:uncharacterized protein
VTTGGWVAPDAGDPAADRSPSAAQPSQDRPAPVEGGWPPPVGVQGVQGPPQAWLPRPYQQLLRGPNLRWWRPLLSVGVVLGSLGLALGGTGLAAGIYLAVTGSGLGSNVDDWLVTPAGLLANNLLLAAFIPIGQLAVWVGFGWRPRWLASVTGGIRWRWLLGCYLVAATVMVSLTGLALLLPGGGGGWNPDPSWPWLLLVVVTTTPLQAAGEEYLFRGWMQQTIGSLFARPVVGALVGGGMSSTLFALAHGQQDPWLFADRFAFGAVASLLAYRTGGLEAGMALHGVNNLVAFALTIAGGQLRATLTATSSDPSSLVTDLVTMLVSMTLVLLVARRLRVVRLFTPPGVGG